MLRRDSWVGIVLLSLSLTISCGGSGETAGNTDNGVKPDTDIKVTDTTTDTASDSESVTDIAIDNEGVVGDIAGNHAPVADDQDVAATEDKAVDIVLTAKDDDGDTLTFLVTVQPSHGTLTGIDTDGKVLDPTKGVTYTPENDYNGTDSFQFVADDGKQKSNKALVSITIQPQADAPVAMDIADIATNEDTPVTFKMKASDVDGDALTYALDSGPEHGAIVMGEIDEDGFQDITYTPERDYAGTDTITYHANDGTADSNIATIGLTVNPVEDAPVATDQAGENAVKTDEDTAVDITLAANDPDEGDELTITIVDQPAHGTLVAKPARAGVDATAIYTYTPDRDFFGTDTFTFKATDKAGTDSNVATVEIAVAPVNDPPVANNQLDIVTDQDVPVNIALSVVDADGDNLTLTLKAPQPAHGTVEFATDGVTGALYTPAPFFPNSHVDGQDEFHYTACDPSGACADAMVKITVHPKNDAPVFAPQTVDTDEDTDVEVTLGATDPDNDAITYTMVDGSGPQHGKVVLVDNKATYTPDENWPADKTVAFAADTFTVQACDPENACTNAIITVQVKPVNDAPVAENQTATTPEDTAVVIALDVTDADGDSLTFKTKTIPGHGSVTYDNAAKTATFTPQENFPFSHSNGKETFIYTVCDTDNACVDASVTVTITHVNDAPVFAAQTVDTDEDTAVEVTLGATDVEGDTITYTMADGTDPQHGTVVLTGGKATYTPDPNWPKDKTLEFAVDTFSLRACDGYTGGGGTEGCTEAIITIQVKPVNDVPTVTSFGTATTENQQLIVQFQAFDADDDVLKFKITALPVHGKLYTVDDTGVATTHEISADETVDKNMVAFVPETDYYTHTGNDPETFRFQGFDGDAYSAEGTITITIKKDNKAPTVENIGVETDEDSAKDIKLNGNDPDGDPLTYSIVAAPDPAKGILTGVGANGLVNGDTVTFTPATNFNGSVTFTYQADDGIDKSNVGTVTVVVNPVNDLPVTLPASLTVDEDSKATASNQVNFDATDVDDAKANLTWKIVSLPANGSLYKSDGTTKLTAGDVISDAKVFYVPNPDWPAGHVAQEDAFNYAACDNHDVAHPCGNDAKVSLTVNAVEDAPVANDQSGIATNEDTATAPIVLDITDADCDALTFSVDNGVPPVEAGMASVEFKQNGTDANGCPTYQAIYTPVPNWPVGHDNKDAIFTYDADDSNGGTVKAKVTIKVIAINDAPDAKDVTVADQVDEDTPDPVMVPLADSVTDADEDTISYSVDATSQNGGTVSVDAVTGEMLYSPPANWPCNRNQVPQVDTMTYHTDGGFGGTSTAHVYITVKPVEDTPTADDLTEQVLEESNNNMFTLVGHDNDCTDVLDYYIVTPPAHGSLANVGADNKVNGNAVLYTPEAGYNGPDSFTYKANDGTKDSNTATVEITVKHVNHAPVVGDVSSASPEDTPLTIQLKGTDSDDDMLDFRIVDTPEHGTLGAFTDMVHTGDTTTVKVVYTPEANYNGPDSFTFVANDGLADSNTGTVTITISAVNDKPVVYDKTAEVNEDDCVDITLTGTDVDGDTLTYSLASNPSYATATLSGNKVHFCPNANWPEGHDDVTDGFTYTANDGTVDSDPQSVIVTVHPVNDQPVAADTSGATDEEKCVTISLSGTDADGDVLTYSKNSDPEHGTVTISGYRDTGHEPKAVYCPNTDWPASHDDAEDSFTYKVDDGNGGTDTATVTIIVHPVNDAPVADDKIAEVDEDDCVTITMTATDADGDKQLFTIETAPENGIAEKSGSDMIHYCPTANWPSGHEDATDTITYKADDGHGGTDTATVTVTVHPINDAPVADDKTADVNEDDCVIITLSATDADGDGLTYSVIDNPTHGTLTTESDTSLKYCTDRDWPTGHDNAQDTFTYKATDGTAESNAATVTITAHPVNDQPVADGAHNYTPYETTSTTTLTGSDADNDSLNWSVRVEPKHGTAVIDGSTLKYTPNTDFHGFDTLVVTADDNQGETNSTSEAAEITFAVGVRFVDLNATGAGTGFTWADAFTTISAANTAAAAYDQIWVKKGTYSGSTLTLGKDNVSLFGSFAGTESMVEQRPAFNSGTADTEFTTLDGNSSNRVITLTASNMVINGFIIKNGQSSLGSGLYTDSAEGLTISGCRFIDNKSDLSGGAIYGRYSGLRLVNCTFFGNHAGNRGAILFSTGGTAITMDHCTAYKNTSDSTVKKLIEESKIGPIYVKNSIFYVDDADKSFSNVNFEYTDIYDGAISTCPANSTCGDGMLYDDPIFEDLFNGNLHIKANSPCIDLAKSTDTTVIDLDRRLRPRPLGTDMGAYEIYFNADSESIYFVDGTNGSDSNDGMSWATAFATVAHAVDKANTDMGILEIWVAGGTYSGNPNQTFMIDVTRAGLAIRGGFAGTETQLEERDLSAGNETVLMGDHNAMILYVEQNKASVFLDSLTFSNALGISGWGTGASVGFDEGCTFARVENCKFKNNPCTNLDADSIGCGLTLLLNTDALVGNTVFTNNTRGAMIVLSSGNVAVYGSTFDSNTDGGVKGAGSAISVNGSILSIQDSLFTNNSTGSPKSAIILGINSRIDIQDSDFDSNTSTQVVWNDMATPGELTITGSTFTNNNGVSVRTPGCLTTITKTSFSDNNSPDGQLEITKSAACAGLSPDKVTVSKCLFSGNTASESGGAIYQEAGILKVTNSIFRTNSAGEYGGAVATKDGYTYLWHNTFYNNQAAVGGHAIFNNNTATGTSMEIRNSIMWPNPDDTKVMVYTASPDNTEITFSDVAGGYSGDGNINSDPKFTDATGNDMHLQYNSPCVDAANEMFTVADDYDDNPRPRGVTTDMGAYEYQPSNKTRQEILYVKHSGNDANDATSWQKAVNTVQQAMSLATADTREIWVEHYWHYNYIAPTSASTAVLDFKRDVGVYGGFGLSNTMAQRNENIAKSSSNYSNLSADWDDNGTGDNPHVVKFSVYGGRIDGFNVSMASGANDGGGVYISNTNARPLVIANCDILENQLTGSNHDGAGIWVYRSDNTMIVNSVVEKNQTESYGGGIYLITSTVRSVGLTVADNTTTETGGGIEVYMTSLLLAKDLIITGNSAKHTGGIYVNSSQVSLENVDVNKNTASTGGAGGMTIYNPSADVYIGNARFWNNNGSRGGGIYADFNSGENGNVYLINASFAKNDNANNKGGAITCPYDGTKFYVFNSNFSGDTDNLLNYEIYANGSTSCVYVEHSVLNSSLNKMITGDEVATGTDPKYTDEANGDLTLKCSSSPAVDRGNGDVAPTLDILGQSRVDSGKSGTNGGSGTPNYTDSGAYECQ